MAERSVKTPLETGDRTPVGSEMRTIKERPTVPPATFSPRSAATPFVTFSSAVCDPVLSYAVPSFRSLSTVKPCGGSKLTSTDISAAVWSN